MKGTRPLDNTEIRLVSACFTGNPYEVRNRGLFMLGVSTGGRISELLSLTIGDVYQNRRAVTDLLFDKSIVKGGEVSRAVPVNTDGMRAIEDLISWHREKYGKLDVKRPLFPSRNKSGSVAMNRQTAHEMLKKAFQDGDIYLVQELLGHRNVSTTQNYLGVNYATARQACESMAVDSQPYRIAFFLSGSLKKEADETLFLELALRGYDLSKLRDEETTGEIVKIS